MQQLDDDKPIDATQFGGRMWFVNHSCKPNCRVVKWDISEQERRGLFAIRCIKDGEEVTFDYMCQSE
jgi:histone-lysine N-methyltransferase ASH1L